MGTYSIRVNVFDGTYNFAKAFTITVLAYPSITGGDTIYGDYITNVTFAGINKTSGDDSGYADYTAEVGTVTQGSSHTLACTFNLSDVTYPAMVMVWFDWNQDFDFNDTTEKYEVARDIAGSTGSHTVNTSITVPLTATVGSTRMRIVSNANTSHDEPQNSGSAVFYGDAEDYTINVQGVTYTISGNAGVGGATLSYTDGSAKTVTADGSGNYSFSVSNNWSGTVTPSQTGYSFTPADRTYTNVLSNQTTQDYTATPITYQISGNAGVAGATLNYTDGSAMTATADGSGDYSFSVPFSWSGTVTPSMTGYTFSPTNRTYTNVTSHQGGQNYTTMLPNAVSLYILRAGPAPSQPPLVLGAFLLTVLSVFMRLRRETVPISVDRG